jgi:ParB/RepB/Spo0J family partition protein
MSTQTGTPIAASIPIAEIRPGKNPRKLFDEDSLGELADSIRSKGVLQPILVRPSGRGFELVAGERRWRAAKIAGLAEIPATVRELSDEDVLEISLIENLQRADLHPLEEAEGYRQLMTRGRYDVGKIAEKTGRSIKYVYDRMKLLDLSKDAKKAFSSGKFTARHAILLARLKPDQQARAMREGALYQYERLLWDPHENGRASRQEALKPVSVREFEGWIDEHVRFPMEAPDPMLFPESALAIKEARETKTKVIPITHDHMVNPEARGEGRIYSWRSWRRADGRKGAKRCPHAVTGVVVAGPERGQAFDVCVSKEACTIHWAKEQREKKRRAAGRGRLSEDQLRKREEEKRKRQQAAEEEARRRWEKARPAILSAIAKRVKVAPARASGLLASIVLKAVLPYGGSPTAAKLVPLGSSAEDLVRHAAFVVICREAGTWDARERFPKRAKAFGVDVAKILKGGAPER